MSVKRYDLVTIYRGPESWDEMEDAEDGTYVRHDDYAELEAKCAALAADNEKAMEAIRQADEVVKRAHSKFAALADENMALRSALENGMTPPETPATDAFLAEVRAQGVEMFAGEIGDYAKGKSQSTAEIIKATGRNALMYAAKLRQGAAL